MLCSSFSYNHKFQECFFSNKGMQFGSHSQIAPLPPGEGGGVPVIWMQHIGYLRVNADIVFHANFSPVIPD